MRSQSSLHGKQVAAMGQAVTPRLDLHQDCDSGELKSQDLCCGDGWDTKM